MNSSEAALAKRRRRLGLCWQCGRVKTHEMHLGILRRKLTVPHQVYKGICLHCNSVVQARLQLNEQVDGALDFERLSLDRHRAENGDDNRSPMTPAESGSEEGPDYRVVSVPATVRTLTRGRDNISTLTLDTELFSGEVTCNSSEVALRSIPGVYGGNGFIDSSDRRPISQAEIERSMTDSAPTGGGYPRLSTPADAQAELNESRFGRSQIEQVRSNSPGGDVKSSGDSSRGNAYDMLLARKYAESSGTGSCTNGYSDNQSSTSPTPTTTRSVPYNDGDDIMTAKRLQEGRSQNSQDSLSPMRPDSFQRVQGLSSSQHNNSASQNMNVGRERNNDSLDQKSRIGPMTVVSGNDTLFSRKIAAKASETSNQSNANSGCRTKQSTTSTKAQVELDQSRFNRSQTKIESSNSPGEILQSSDDSCQRSARFVQLDQDRNSSQHNNYALRHRSSGGSNASSDPNFRGVTSVVGSEFDTLLERKFAIVSETDDRINADSGYQAPLSSTITEAQKELERSRLGGSQSEQERSNSLSLSEQERLSIGNNSPMLNRSRPVQSVNSSEQSYLMQNMSVDHRGRYKSLDRNKRIGSTAVGFEYDSLFARKLAAEAQANVDNSRLGRFQAESDRGNSLTPLTDRQHNSNEGISSHGLGSQRNASIVRLDQDLNASQQNVISRNMSFGQGRSMDSLDPNLQGVAANVGSDFNTLLERKLRVTDGTGDRIHFNSVHQAPLASTSYESQPNSTSTEQDRNKFLTSQTKQEPNSKIDPVADESRFEVLLAGKFAESSYTGSCTNGYSDDQTSTFPSPATTRRVPYNDGDDIMTAKRLQEERSQNSQGSIRSSRSDSFQQVKGLSTSQNNNSSLQSTSIELSKSNDSLDRNTRIGPMAVVSGNDTLFARKIAAEASGTDNRINDRNVNQAQLFSTPTIIGNKCFDDNNDQMAARRRQAAGVDSAPTGNDTTHRRHVIEECISDVEAYSDASCCRELLDALKRSSLSSKAATITSLAKIRVFVLEAHGMTRNDHPISIDSLDCQIPFKLVFPDDEWAKILVMIMASYSSDTFVQADLLRTLWSIVTIHPQYVSHLTSNADITQVITTKETHINEEAIQEYGCGILASIASASEMHALCLIGVSNGKFVHRLMAALQFQCQRGNVQMNALKALDRLSLASISNKSSKESFLKTMGRYVENSLRDTDSSVNAIETVINSMKYNAANISVQIHGNRLLWSILDPRFIIDSDYYDMLAVKTLRCIDAAMSTHQQSQALHEAAVCLLSKMSWFLRDVIEKDLIFLLHLVVKAMKAEAMTMHSNSWIVALHGCQCLANICKRSPSLLRSQPVSDGIPAIVSCMKIFQHNVEIQSEACAALSVLCIHSPPNKERVNEMDGINRINHAYDLLSTSTTTSNADKIRACTALTTLAVDPNILSDIEEKGIFVKFKTLLEQDHTIASELHEAILALLILSPHEKNRKLMLRDGAQEEEICGWLRANLRVVASQDFDPRQINYLRCKTVHAMEMFSKSASIHENGCKLLACLFYQASHDESFAEDRLIAELEAICHSLTQHTNNPANAIAACSALQNLSILLSFSMSDNVPGLKDALYKCSAEVAKALVEYSHDAETLERVTGALWALCVVRDSLDLSFDIDCSIVLIVSAMNRFPDSVDLHRHGIGLMGLFFLVLNDKIEVTDELVSAILRFIEEEIDNDNAADLINTAVDMILTMSNQGFLAQTTLLRHKLVIATVVDCMEKFPDSLSIQCAGIEILNNVAIDSHWRKEVSEKGGMMRIISTLDTLRHDPIVVCRAYTAFANLLKGAGDEILRDLRAPEIFVTAMQLHSQNLYIQTVATNALWTLSARKQTTNAPQALSELNVLLRMDIVDAGGAEAISETMMRFIASKQILLPGFAVLWNLAEPSDLKMRVGRCAIRAVTSGISAHVRDFSPDACKYALGCLKCLSSSPVNRKLLEDYRADDLVYTCMWLHADNASVCNAALSALVNVSAYVDRNRVSEIASSELDAIVNAMRNHQSIKSIQQNALIVLKKLSLCRANVMVMDQNPFIVPLINSAKSTCPTLQGRADELLRVLSAT